MRKYKCLNQQEFEYGEYQLVPIRHKDRYDIMQWRNEQIYHLRQAEPLTKKNKTDILIMWWFNFLNKNSPVKYLFIIGEEYASNKLC